MKSVMKIPAVGAVYDRAFIASLHGKARGHRPRLQSILRVLTAGCVLMLSGAVHLQETRTLSIFFEENRGQAPSDARFLARGAGYSLAFTPRGSHVALSHSGKRLSFTTTLTGANSNPTITGEEKQPGRANYFRGDRSITNIPTYGRIRYRGIYPGIDLVYY